LEKILAGTAAPPRIVLDTEAIGSVRDAEQAALTGTPFNIGAALSREFAHTGLCQAIVAVSAQEAAVLRDLGSPNIHIVGHVRTPRPGVRSFSDRSGLLFAGAIHKMDSPNYDSLCWLIEDVLPIVEQSLGWETRLTIAGYTSPDVSLDRFKGHPRVSLRGVVPDLEPLYASHRVFVAPTRFAAGAPYKVHEAASFGLPIVVTDLLRRQLAWGDGQEVLAADAADPAAFAARIVQLYRDEALWEQVRLAALRRLEREHNPTDYSTAIQAALRADGGPAPN
jgi:glycosyltransferase involved in cell wall biosynthesis